MRQLSQRLITGITSQLDHVVRNGDPDQSYPGDDNIHIVSMTTKTHLGCVNLSFAFVEGESLLMGLKDIALSSGRCVY